MNLVPTTKVFVGVARRADSALTKRDEWYPQSYVRIDIDGTVFILSPVTAKSIARALKAAADVIAPPPVRKPAKRST